jgi:hypothetical protein
MTNYQQFKDVLNRIPPVQAFFVFCLSLPFLLFFRDHLATVGALVTTWFAVASPLVGVRHSHFWLYQFGSLASQLVLITVYIVINQIIGKNEGESDAAFFLPTVATFAMFPLMCIIGLCSPRSPPPIPPPSDNKPGH